MSHRALSQGQFPEMFHGTTAVLRPGAVITGGMNPLHSTSPRNVSYATTRRDWATRFAQTAADSTERSPHVYEVEPTGYFEPDPGFPRSKGTAEEHAYQSRSGFRVVREIDPWVGPTTESIARVQRLREQADLGRSGFFRDGSGAVKRVNQPPRLRR